MTNFENRIENLRKNKQNFSFLTDMESLLSEKYKDIWDDIDESYIRDMVREEVREKNQTVLYLADKDSSGFRVIKTLWDIESVKVDKNKKYDISIDSGWNYRKVKLDKIYLVNDIDAYLDYLLELRNKDTDENIEEYKKIIKRQEQNKKDDEQLAKDIKRINKELNTNFTFGDSSKVHDILRKEKFLKGELTLSELTNLNNENYCVEVCDGTL